MPIPTPKGDKKKKYLTRCMEDGVMVKEFADSKQRYAVCQSKWKKAKSSEYSKEDEDSDIIMY